MVEWESNHLLHVNLICRPVASSEFVTKTVAALIVAYQRQPDCEDVIESSVADDQSGAAAGKLVADYRAIVIPVDASPCDRRHFADVS